MEDLLREYDRRLEPARRRFEEGTGIAALMSADADPRDLLRLLIEFASRCVPMVQPVEGWIARAAVGCDRMGLRDVGRALKGHAASESGHHLMAIHDTHALVGRWNALYSPPLDAQGLLDREPGPGASRYCAIHESVVNGDSPFAQVALEHEIERLPVAFGGRLMAIWTERLGPGIASCLTFVAEHTILDVGHTAFNRKLLGGLLEADPGRCSTLVDAGTSILDAYAQFLADCARYESVEPAAA